MDLPQVGKVCAGAKASGGAQDVRRSDLREEPVREKPHLASIRDEDAGNINLSAALGLFFGPVPGARKRDVDFKAPIRGPGKYPLTGGKNFGWIAA